MKLKLIVFALLSIGSLISTAQEKGGWKTGVDIYSSYVWRGAKFGSGPAMQPSLTYSNNGFSIGAWGNYCFSQDEAPEADLFISYETNLGENSTLAFNLYDYYFSGWPQYFDQNSHYFEPQIVLGLNKFTLTGAYMTNAEDVYFEAGYAVGEVELFAGAGDGQYTNENGFNLCNLGIKTSKEIKITDNFTIPVNGAVILNPATEQLYVVVGFTISVP